MRILTLKATLLLALASFKHVGDLQTLSVSKSSAPGLVKAFLRPRPGYVPKVLPKMDKVLRQELQIPLQCSTTLVMRVLASKPL